jgi:hypothetical protein
VGLPSLRILLINTKTWKMFIPKAPVIGDITDTHFFTLRLGYYQTTIK